MRATAVRHSAEGQCRHHWNTGVTPCVVFALDGLRFGLPLDRVERAIRAVALRALPQAPDIVSGVFNLQGRIVPVVNVRRRFGLRERELAPADQLLIVGARRTVAMIVDGVDGVVDCREESFVPIDAVVGGTNHVQGVVKTPGGMVLIQDLDRFLSLDEEQSLAAALDAAGR